MDSRISSGIGGAGQGAALGFTIGGPVGGVIGGIAGGLLGALGGGGEDEAEKLAEMQATQIKRAARWNKRIGEQEMDWQVGTARAASAASGLIDSGSTRRYRTELESRYRQDIEYNYGKAMFEARMAEKGGQIAAQQIQNAALGSMLSGIGSLGGTLAGAGVFSKATPNPTFKGNVDSIAPPSLAG